MQPRRGRLVEVFVDRARFEQRYTVGEMARNQSGRLSGSMCWNSKSIFFSRSTIATRCTQGQVLKLTSRYFAMAASDGSVSWRHDGSEGRTVQMRNIWP